jgi:hypothetical protein
MNLTPPKHIVGTFLLLLAGGFAACLSETLTSSTSSVEAFWVLGLKKASEMNADLALS